LAVALWTEIAYRGEATDSASRFLRS
jgi:hypothetical protein